MLNWLQQFDTFCFLDNHQYQIAPHSQECLVAAGARGRCTAGGQGALQQLQEFLHQRQDKWLFGHLNYDFAGPADSVFPTYPDLVQFPGLCFFEPAILIRLNEREMIIDSDEPVRIFSEIMEQERGDSTAQMERIDVNNRLQKEDYISIVKQLQQHILRGDCYEINFCQEFYAEGVKIDPLAIYSKLSAISPNPFSALYRLDDKWLLCASPERFLKKEGSRIVAQPIKGTAKRINADQQLDEKSKSGLFHSQKDRSENVMIVDLMRNDLSKFCEEGSVKVDELYGVYSFPQVHQMISTISGQVKSDVHFAEIIEATFPMGSMTGAPKKKVMELISRYEKTKRGIFSGTLGYITPGGDFDLNVIIRSIMYNSTSNYLSFQTGSGITFYSDPAKEWEECLLKAEAMKKCFSPQ